MAFLLPRKTAVSNCNLSVHPVSNRRSRHREVVFQAYPSQASLKATATGNAGDARRLHAHKLRHAIGVVKAHFFARKIACFAVQ
jgi:hypothetical protein